MRLEFPVYENKEVDIVVKVEGSLQQTKHKERKFVTYVLRPYHKTNVRDNKEK